MARESKAQKETIERVLHEKKEAILNTSAGKKVISKKQALAIALNEAGASHQKSPKKIKATLNKTKAAEAKRMKKEN